MKKKVFFSLCIGISNGAFAAYSANELVEKVEKYGYAKPIFVYNYDAYQELYKRYVGSDEGMATQNEQNEWLPGLRELREYENYIHILDSSNKKPLPYNNPGWKKHWKAIKENPSLLNKKK